MAIRYPAVLSAPAAAQASAPGQVHGRASTRSGLGQTDRASRYGDFVPSAQENAHLPGRKRRKNVARLGVSSRNALRRRGLLAGLRSRF